MSRKELALALVVFFLATLVYTFPLVTAPSEANRLDSPDALLNTWIVSWNLHQLAQDPLHLFDANIFFPEKGTLAYSENLVTGSLIAAPARLVSANPIWLYNSALVGAFVLTALATFALAYDVTHDRLASILAGLLFGFAPYRFAHIPHLQLLLAFGIPLSVLFARRLVLGKAPLASAVGFALSTCATFGSSVYYAVYVASILPIVVLAELWCVPRAARLAAVKRLMLASLGGLLITLPLAVPYVSKLEGGTVRSLSAASEFSAGWTEYVSSFSWAHGFLPKAGEPLFPGFVAVGLAVVAMVGPARDGTRRGVWAAIGLFGVWLSLGPAFGLFSFLYHVAAPYRALRVPSRAGVLFLLAVALLAAGALATVRSRRARALLVGVAAVECLAAPLPLSMSVPVTPPIYEDVAALDAPGALVELPLPPPERFQDNAVYVYRSIEHRRSIVNGYSGFAPSSYRRAHRWLMRRELARGLKALHPEGVRFVLAHEGRLGPRMRRQIRQSEAAGLLELVAERGPDRLYSIEVN